MGRRGARRTVERGIYRDGSGYEVIARAGSRTRSKRFAPDASLASLRTWRDGTAADLREAAQPTRDDGSLRAAVARYRDRTQNKAAPDLAALNAWVQLYGDLPRRKLTPALAQQALERWKHAGYSAQSLYYRRLVIDKLWKALDGPQVKTPVVDIHISRPKRARPVWVADGVVLEVLRRLKMQEMVGRLRTPKTRARLLVLATTGQRPAQLKRTQRGDVIFYRQPDAGIYGVWWVRGAKGGDPTPVYLNAEMRTAWEAFVVADAWGVYNTRSFARTLRSCGWPAGIRPYTVRHATGITLSEAGIDLADIQAHMGHTDSQTTRTYYVPQLHSRLKTLSTTLEGRFSGGRVAPERGTLRKAGKNGRDGGI
jgi:integrase